MSQLTDEGIRIARRVVAYMLEAAEQSEANRLSGQREYICPGCGKLQAIVDVDINHERSLSFFMGLGMSLAVIYEEMTGRPAGDKKPQQLMEWAKDLPAERYRHTDRA